jgi:hypothetical protein
MAVQEEWRSVNFQQVAGTALRALPARHESKRQREENRPAGGSTNSNT